MSKCKRFVLGPPTLRFGFFLALVLIIQAFPSRAGQAWEPVSRFVTIADTSIVPQLSLSDSIPPLDSLRSENVVLPPDSAEDIEFINASIFYDARDTIVLDAAENKVRLYGNAVVKYETMVLSADYIEYSFTNNAACAAGVPDSLGVLQGKPVFDDNGQSFTQEYLCYNFRTKKGFSRNSVTKEGDAVFHAAQSKRHTNEWVHIKGGKFTTCDADNPHFHFHLSKAIIVPDEKVVSGPMYLKVRKVPLPLALPFAWFPNKDESTHGVVFPGYGNANELGYFLKDGGYYFPIGRVADVRILGDIYSRGSWSLRNITNYNSRYRFNGSFNVSRTVVRRSLPELPDFSKATEFFIRWTHNQDPKARPNSNFSTNINFGTANNFRNNLNSSQADYLSNTFTSSAQWNKQFAGKPWSLAVTGRHSQNSATGNVELLLPAITLNRNRTNLPVSKWLGKKVGGRKWYDQIGLTYSANFENLITEKVENIRWDRFNELNNSARNGIRHSAALTSQAKLGFVTFTPSFNYNEFWTFRYTDLVSNSEQTAFVVDTLSGFRTARDWRMSGSFNTRFYGTFNFRKAKSLQAIRHVITPQAGVSYVPRFDRNTYFYNGETGNVSTFDQFSVARFRPASSQEQFNINFSVANNLEAKIRDREAGGKATKKVKIIENFVVNGSYNMIADSLNLSDISMRGFTTLFQGLTLNVNASHSAYDRNANGQRINRFLLESQGKLLRLNRAQVALGWNFRSKNPTGTGPNTSNASEEQLEAIEQNRNQFVDFNIPWSLNVNYTLSVNRNWSTALQADESDITQSLLFNGDVSIFERWKIGFDSGFDFVARELTPTTLNLYWDLHCWELSFNYIPFGFRRSFSLQINVKSALLSDLKLQARGGGGNGLLF
jgi:hypothetical protein